MLKTFLYKRLMMIALSFMAMLFSVESFGQPPPPPHHPPGRVIVRQPLPPFGRVIPRPPPDDLRVVIGVEGLFFHDGVFYRKAREGYIVEQPPVGVIIPAIPAGFVTFVSGGITYYFYGGVYYREVPSGYTVVEAPPNAVIAFESPEKAAPTPTTEQRVSVIAQRLNVRSGPGQEHPVVEQVEQGAVLIIKGTAPGWYYVELPNGKYGWVGQVYTNPYSPPASGSSPPASG